MVIFVKGIAMLFLKVVLLSLWIGIGNYCFGASEERSFIHDEVFGLKARNEEIINNLASKFLLILENPTIEKLEEEQSWVSTDLNFLLHKKTSLSRNESRILADL